MSVPAIASPPASEGLLRSASLMRALGPRAASVWATLSPQEAEHLSAAMQTLPDDVANENDAALSYMSDMAQRPLQTGPSANSIWQQLSDLEATKLSGLIANESPQIIAVILANMMPQAAATAVRTLPTAQATDVLRRLVNLGEVRPVVLKTLETSLAQALTGNTKQLNTNAGHERVARIFDNLDSRAEQGLLTALDRVEPGSGDRIRALMFTFDDLASLDPASIQTLLAGTDRAVLIVALKGAGTATAEVFFSNMTSRAGDLLRSEIEAAGPVRRSEIDAARSEVIALARSLVNRGDILSDPEDDELVE